MTATPASEALAKWRDGIRTAHAAEDRAYWIEERAAILEYDAGVPRDEAREEATKMWEKLT